MIFRKLFLAVIAVAGLVGPALPAGAASPAKTCEFPRYVGISDVRAYEGTGNGLTTFVFIVDTSGCSHAATIGYTTNNGTANSSDFTPVSGTLTWPDGDTSIRTITVVVNRDSLDESNEDFTVSLTSISGFNDISGPGVGTILDDDGPVSWNLDDAQCGEGDPPPAVRLCTVTITLSLKTPVAKTVNVTTTNQTATSPGDYNGFTNKQVSVPSNGDIVQFTVELKTDDLCEANETFGVTLSGPSTGTLADPSAVVTIAEDDFFCDV